ncbi:MAG: lytic transglycosylase domain-containing protein [Shimia sp.]|nr:lytic transglycosylase domain-containing protein [Shimia sp.]
MLAMLASVGTATESPLWKGFYTSSAPAPKPAQATQVSAGVGDPETACVNAILESQARYDIPDNLLLAIGLQEAGRNGRSGLTVWPWTANANGEGRFFADQQSLLDWVRMKQGAGVSSIDVGCMQINQYWHADAFASLEHAATPAANVDYAARYLVSLYQEGGDWWQAAGRYHSSTEDKRTIYLARLERNLAVAQARRADPAQVAQAPDTPVVPDAPKAPEPPVFWGSSTLIVGSEEQRSSFSIYSNRPLNPVLPDYQEWF